MRHALMQWVMKVVVALSAGLGAWTSGEAQSLTWLGTLGGWDSVASGVSTDGRVVVGWSSGRAFRWENGVMQDLGTLGGFESAAYGVSADGRVVVGWASNASGLWRAFRWENGVMQDLGTLGGNMSQASGVSADGRVVVGAAVDTSNRLRAFRWENGVMQDLGTLGGASSDAWGVSADGRVVVGRATDASGGKLAFRWVEGRTPAMEGISIPRSLYTLAYGVSADGRVVVGQARYTGRNHAFRWENGVMQDLGTLGGNESAARSVSANGRVVVGWAVDTSNRRRAFRWTAETGMQDLNQVFASLLTDGSHLVFAYAVSPDGRYIVGWGYNAATEQSEGFLLDTWRTGDTNGDGCIDDADLLSVLFAFGTPGTGDTRHEDINKDGIVDDADLLMVLSNFGSGC